MTSQKKTDEKGGQIIPERVVYSPGQVIEQAGAGQTNYPIARPGYANLIAMAVEKDVDIEKLKQLMELENKWEEKQARKAFFLALSQFQSGLPEIGKRGKAGFDHKEGGGKTEYSFAKLEDIASAIRPGLSVHALSYRFEQIQTPGESFERQGITVTCVVTHSAGHSERMTMSSTPDTSGKKNPIQAIASTVSYLRRYTLTGALGIVVGGEDDDAASTGDAVEEVDQTVYCTNEFFNDSLPKWQDAIIVKNRKVDDLVAFLRTKHTILSPDQINILKESTK